LTGFHVGWEIDFYDFAIEAKDGLEVGLDDIAREIGDHDNLGICFFIRLFIHVHVDITRLGRS